MCGISGVVNKNNLPVDKNFIQRFNNTLSHRGPDGDGVFYGQNFALAHRRLRILDLSENGKQPMLYRGKVCITFNGEIYNYLEVKSDLQKKGYTFSSTSDTEVILAAYLEWGVECLSRFNGMWAFIIFDQEKNQLFISRDRFGVKPLYYTEYKDSIYFGSELKQVSMARDRVVVDEYMMIQKLVCHLENHSEKTFFKDVFSLPASHYMIYDLNSHRYIIQRYYELIRREDITKLNESDSIALLEDRIKRSIQFRLRSDVTVGTCLSGGVDSSIVSAIASQMYTNVSEKNFLAINAKSIQKSRDESAYANLVANYLDLDFKVVEPNYEDFKQSIDAVVYSQDEPFGSPSMFMGYHVFKKARAENCIVMLNGQGGDEILLGYERYFVASLFQENGLNKLKAAYNFYQNSRLTISQTLLYILYFGSGNMRKSKLKHSTFVKSNYLNTVDFSYIEEYAKKSNDIFELQKFEMEKIQLPKLLRYEDRNSMVNSIETRLPYLDYNVVEAALSFDNRLKIKDGWSKYLLRKIGEKYLPKEIAWRKNKFGFEAPEEIWLKQHHDGMLQEIKKSDFLRYFVDVERLVKSFSTLGNWDKWMYYNTAVWARIFNANTN